MTDARPPVRGVSTALIAPPTLRAPGAVFPQMLRKSRPKKRPPRRRRQAAQATGGRHAITGPVAVTTATAGLGSINVYLSSIGTVTPVYTASISAQVTGVITARPLSRRAASAAGRSAVDIDPRPYAAQLAEAQGLLERDQNLLAEAQMDLDRYKVAWVTNAIPRQTLEDQEKLVLQDQGTVKNDQGTVAIRQGAAWLLPHCFADQRPRRPSPCRSGQPGHRQLDDDTGGRRADQPITVIFTLAKTACPRL